MKKNNGPFINAIIFGFALVMSPHAISADDEVAPTQAANTTPSEPSTTENKAAEKQNNKRVIPTPQKARLQALETNLKQNHLDYQIKILQAEGSDFLTLHRKALTGDQQGCAILLHSDNEHPNWPTVISPLRNALPKYSWCTLSIEIPDITKRAKAVETPSANSTAPTQTEPLLPNQNVVFARIQATISSAKAEGNKQFVFIGYGTGAAYAMHFLAQNKTMGDALILIDIKSPRTVSDYFLAQDLSLIEQPVLDTYFDRSAEAHRFSVWRKQAANQRKGDTGEFIQLDTTGSGAESKQQNIQLVRGFLKQNTTQIDQLKSLPEYKKGLFYKSP